MTPLAELQERFFSVRRLQNAECVSESGNGGEFRGAGFYVLAGNCRQVAVRGLLTFGC